MINGLPGFNALNIRIGQIEVHDYDIKKNLTAANINSYDQNNPALLKQVLETRRLVQQSFFEEIKLSEAGLKINTLTTPHAIFPQALQEEVNTLTGILENQLGYLKIPREHFFQLRQNDKGEIIVEDVPSEINDSITSKLNSSEHFKETFHLLKTAEKVLHSNDKTNLNEQLAFKLSISSESITSMVSVVESSGKDTLAAITDQEMYHLARYGIAARKTQSVYLGDVAHYRYNKL